MEVLGRVASRVRSLAVSVTMCYAYGCTADFYSSLWIRTNVKLFRFVHPRYPPEDTRPTQYRR